MIEVAAGAKLDSNLGRSKPDALLLWVLPCHCCTTNNWHMRGPYLRRDDAVAKMRHLFAKDNYGRYLNPENFLHVAPFNQGYSHAAIFFHTSVNLLPNGLILLGNEQLISPTRSDDRLPWAIPHDVPFEVRFITEPYRFVRQDELENHSVKTSTQ